eukprot:g4102.t1
MRVTPAGPAWGEDDADDTLTEALVHTLQVCEDLMECLGRARTEVTSPNPNSFPQGVANPSGHVFQPLLPPSLVLEFGIEHGAVVVACYATDHADDGATAAGATAAGIISRAGGGSSVGIMSNTGGGGSSSSGGSSSGGGSSGISGSGGDGNGTAAGGTASDGGGSSSSSSSSVKNSMRAALAGTIRQGIKTGLKIGRSINRVGGGGQSSSAQSAAHGGGLVLAPHSALIGQKVVHRGRVVTVLDHVETSIPVAHLRDGLEAIDKANAMLLRLKMNVSSLLTLVGFSEARFDDDGAVDEEAD